MGETGRKIVIVVVLLLVVVFGVGQFFAFSNIPTGQNQPAAPTNQNANPPTDVVTYEAAVPSTSTPIQSGSCFASSIAAPYRTDAWRCTVGNAISDPCFAIAGTKNLLCGANPAEGPYATSTFVLRLAKALPSATLPAGGIPANWAWAVQFADGTYCTPLTGTRPVTATGVMGTYACASPNPQESLILGDLNANASTWTATVGSLSVSTSSLPTVSYSALLPIARIWQ
ncbi:MAG TPA: hypothetical protein VMT99_04125 [Candidatus Paceibacterota bacterium]|nr:hypothetical protein [Candidatus Paceibacterota bacterium]